MPKQQASAAFGIAFGLLATSASGQTDVKVVQLPGEIRPAHVTELRAAVLALP